MSGRGASENEKSSRIFQLVLFRKIGDGENYPFPGSTVKTGGQHHKCPSKWLHFLLQYLLLLLLPYHRTNITSISPSIFAALIYPHRPFLCERHREASCLSLLSPPLPFPLFLTSSSLFSYEYMYYIGFFPFSHFYIFPSASLYIPISVDASIQFGA